MDKNLDLKVVLKIYWEVYSWKKKCKLEVIKDVCLYEYVKINCMKGIVYKLVINILVNVFEWKRLRDIE